MFQSAAASATWMAPFTFLPRYQSCAPYWPRKIPSKPAVVARHYTSQLGHHILRDYDARIRLPLHPTDFTPPPAVPTVFFSGSMVGLDRPNFTNTLGKSNRNNTRTSTDVQYEVTFFEIAMADEFSVRGNPL